MTAYYNEIDPYAAQWLRNLIAAGHIAPGEVDERSIKDVQPDDLEGFTQCHFFAGIGVWSYALRRAGWSDDRPVWTGSCPCQPFSAAGKGEGLDDPRHLWPDWFRLISEREPVVIFGEQVAGPDGVAWLDLAQSDLEERAHAVGAVVTCSAGFGAPDLRHRIYWVAHPEHAERRPQREEHAAAHGRNGSGRRGYAGGMADTHGERLEGFGLQLLERGSRSPIPEVARRSEARGLGDTDGARGATGIPESPPRPSGDAGVVDDGGGELLGASERPSGGRHSEDGSPGPLNGFWRAADWLFCTDGRWRPVEPGTFPLDSGVANRLGRLRAYGNAINAEAAREFIGAYMDVV